MAAKPNIRFLLLGSPIAAVGAAAKERNVPCDHSQGKWIPWNKGKLVGQKAPPKSQEVWSIRVRLPLAKKKRDLALFNLAIDSKLRGCDLLRLRVSDLRIGGEIRSRAKIIQQKTGDAEQFDVTKQTRDGAVSLMRTSLQHPVSYSRLRQ